MKIDLIEKLKQRAMITTENQQQLDEEKFVQLIVQECCNAIRLDDAFNGGKFMRIIKTHFGIESCASSKPNLESNK